MNDITDAPTIAERLAAAGNASNLAVDPDRRRPVDVLIASGLAPSVVGRLLDQLVSEWDGCAKPRRLSAVEVGQVAASLPRVPAPKGGKADRLDVAGAMAQVAAWYDSERRAALMRLKTLPKLLHPNFGLAQWLTAKGCAAVAADVLLDVLGWYLDRCCERCNGTKWELIPGTNRQSAKPCSKCKGSGESLIPHGRLGKDIVWHLADCAGQARAGTKASLGVMKSLKYYVADRRM